MEPESVGVAAYAVPKRLPTVGRGHPRTGSADWPIDGHIATLADPHRLTASSETSVAFPREPRTATKWG
jgi:hypothetical protein